MGHHIHSVLEYVQTGLTDPPQEEESLNLFVYLHRDVSVIVTGLHSPG